MRRLEIRKWLPGITGIRPISSAFVSKQRSLFSVASGLIRGRWRQWVGKWWAIGPTSFAELTSLGNAWAPKRDTLNTHDGASSRHRVAAPEIRSLPELAHAPPPGQLGWQADTPVTGASAAPRPAQAAFCNLRRSGPILWPRCRPHVSAPSCRQRDANLASAAAR